MALKNDSARATMEAACQRTADSLRFCPPHIPHAVVAMVIALTFHNKDPDGMGDSLNIFLFPDLSPLEVSEAALLTRNWYKILESGTLISFEEKNF